MTTGEEFELLGRLAAVNTGMGRAATRILDHQQEHGTLPSHELRALGEILGELSDQLRAAADRLDRPVIDGR